MLAREAPCFSDSSPLLARVGGLPGTTVLQLSSDLCDKWLTAQFSLTRELEATRAELIDRLYELAGSCSPQLRRFLLDVKRDAFNGRSFSHKRADSRWSDLAQWIGPTADRLSALEEQLDRWSRGYVSAYLHCREREHRDLLSTLADSGFRRGLSLASPALAEAAERARRDESSSSSRRESRLNISLLRYVSRTALKLSPFSTLTRIAVGKVDATVSTPLSWMGGRWKERSLLRVQRYLIEQDVEVLCRYRPLREGLRLTLNPTLEETSSGRFRLIRPERWIPVTDAGTLQHESAARAEINVPPHLAASVFGQLHPGRPRVYRAVVAALVAELGGIDGGAAAALDSLIEAGVLLLLTPWPSNEPHLEKRLLSHLCTLPRTAGLAAVIEALESLVTLERGFSKAADPSGCLADIDRALEALWHATTQLAGIEPGIERSRIKGGDFCEDVLLVPPEAGDQEVLRVSQTAVREIVRSAEPWSRITAFQGFRLDFLYTLTAFMRRHWPSRRKVGLLDLFGAAQPLWREYRKLTASGVCAWQAAFNPLGLGEVAALANSRKEMWTSLQEILRALPAGQPLPGEDLEELASHIPEAGVLPLGPCLFVQPADAAGRLWVLNRLFEGTGRYSSRFTIVMDEENRRRFSSRYVRAALHGAGGERLDLLDLMWSHRDTLNVHAVQTARVLALPGETLDRQAAEPVELRDLYVSLDGTTGLPRLTDAGGRSLLPVHLGGTSCHRMPFLVQFLAQWGPGEIRPLRTPVPARREGDVHVFERLTTGCLVLARRRWLASLGEELRQQAAAASDEIAFAVINRWRIRQNLPEKIFLIEKTRYAKLGDVHKPQYLDFTSPLFVELFRSALRLNSDPLTFEEALPIASELPLGPQGERWAVELQIDTLILERDALSLELAVPSDAPTTSLPLVAHGRSV